MAFALMMVASMAQSHAVGCSVQQTLQQNIDEPVPIKRKKKDSGAPAGKSVVVLKSCDVTIGDNYVGMPNTIEMARLKKKEKEQFLTNVQISSKMTQKDIRELLISLFPYLRDQRFYCASAVKNRTRLDFHGEPRIWDGRLIKQKIKGNSALYIYTDEGCLGKQDSTSSKQSTLKRPHDQMTQTMQSECRIDKDGTTQNIVSTASQSQSRKPAMHVADGQAEGRKSSLLPHSDLQGTVSSSLTSQLNSLSIASAASEQERGQLGQTAAGGYDLADVPLEANTSWRGQGNGAATGVQDITCNSTDQSKLGSVVSAEVQCAGKRGSVSYSNEAHMGHAGTSGSDFEPQSSESAVERPSDSGIEGSDNLFVDDRVKDIRPDSCSVKGGVGFYMALNEALPDEVKKGVANFEGVAAVTVDKENSLLLSGTIPPSQKAGEVMVTVTSDSGQYIGYTWFKYTDEEFAVNELLKRLVKDRTLQSKYFAMLSQELKEKSPASDSKKPEALGQLNVPHLGSSVETKQNQSVELLQLMVYTAAQTNAQRFIEMVFSTSAGQVVFNYYKDRTPLPEDVARANGYDKLAQYLQDLHTRLSLDKNVHSTVIDWLELVEAVQKQSLTTQDESPVGLDQSDEDDDNSSDYFADTEKSSCGSSDDDTGWPKISEKKEPCINDEISNEVQYIGECDDLPMTRSSKASFTKNDLNNENSIRKEPCIHDEISNEVQSIGTAFSAINTPTALHETAESPAKRNHRKRDAYKEGPIVELWFGLGWFEPAILCLLTVLLIIIFVLTTRLPGTTMLSAETSTTNSPSQHHWNCSSCIPCFECPPSYDVKRLCAKKQETDSLFCLLSGYNYSNTGAIKCCMARSGCADGIYIEQSAHDRLCTTRKWSTKILSVQIKQSPTLSRFCSSTIVKERKEINETVNIEKPESADTLATTSTSCPSAHKYWNGTSCTGGRGRL